MLHTGSRLPQWARYRGNFVQVDNSRFNVHIINVDNVRILYEYASKEYNASINIAKMADDNSTELGADEARREGVIAGIRAMANAYQDIRNTITSSYNNLPSSVECELEAEYKAQDRDKGLAIALKVSPLIGSSKATYMVSIDTLFRHYGNLSMAVSKIVELLKVQKEALQ